MLHKISHNINKTDVSYKMAFFSITGVFLVFILLNALFPLRIDIRYSTIITDKDSTVIHAFLTPDDKWRMYTRLDEITPQLRKAIVYKEDRFFYYHPGINPLAIVRAALNNVYTGHRTSGASTITMQVARLLQPKKRSYLNKILEMFRALQLEWHFSKNEILQLYLNLVPYGGNIEGVKSASVIYFGKAPNHLSIGEIASLSIVPNDPNSLMPHAGNRILLNKRNKWLARYKKAGLFKEQYITDALEEPLDAYRRDVPRFAPHLSYRLKDRYYKNSIIYTTLDLEIQRKVQKLVRDHTKHLYFSNIKNAIALVIDNTDNNVLAYVGSADFSNAEDGGQVDGIRALRSPGSTLKPLLYGLCFDHGLITPKSVITDVPTSFGGYEPENYNGCFNGNVSVEYALCNSLNIPAVKMLEQYQPLSFMTVLGKINFRFIEKHKNQFGLSSILGGCGVTMEELTGLYCAFAHKGIFNHLKYVPYDTLKDNTKVLSPQSTFMITEILTELTRPDLPNEWQNSAHMPKIAWKTGTSYGRKDAWSIGYNKDYTIGVWVGNFSGEGVPELTGVNMAAPLLFKIFNTVDYHSETEWYSMPDGLEARFVCSESGNLPAFFCNNQVMDYYIPGISPNKKCEHMKMVLVNPDSTVSYCMSCKPEAGYIKALYPNYSPEIIQYFEDHHIPYKKIPPHNSKCERLHSGSAPTIISPIHMNDYYVNELDSMQIMLKCNAANDVETVYWYINKEFYKSAKADEQLFFQPAEGNIDISCSDDKGRNTDISIQVFYVEL
jgi:penicillin-binding protein 1C